MEDSFILNNRVYSYNNNILFEIVNKLENIANNLTNNLDLNNIIEQIRNIIIIINKVIKDNNKNIILLRKDINNLRQDIFNHTLKNEKNNFFQKKETFEETQNKNNIVEVNEISNFNSNNRYIVDINNNIIEEEKILYCINGNDIDDDNSIEALFLTQNGRVIFRNGLFWGIIHKYSEIDNVVSKIQNILLRGVKFILVYKASESDYQARTFHKKCDNINMSLVLIETDQGVRFGGFTTKNWKGAFVFNLDNNTIFDVIENRHAIGCYPELGPIFLGCQIKINNDFFTIEDSTCYSGLNYRTNIDYELNNGQQRFLVKDIEVYSIEPVNFL